MSLKIDQISESIKLDKLSKSLLIVGSAIVVFSFFTPYIFTRKAFNNLEFSSTGPIGDTIGGIMNPFIAIAGVLLTFLAFYIQFKANKTQFQLFRLELDTQNINQQKQAIENRFYEMLSLHKENVKEIDIHLIQNASTTQGNVLLDHHVSGRPAFELMRKEFELLYYLTKENFQNEASFDQILNEAYGIFYHGFRIDNIGKHVFFSVVNDIINMHKLNSFDNLIRTVQNFSRIEWSSELTFELFKGRSSILSHYLRHLFQTVKFIANQNEDLVSYEEKRNYIRLLRAQLSESEQALIFYNWKSKFGIGWENELNHFFTDFRMIHNLYDYILIPDINLNTVPEFKREFRKEKNRSRDPLFEYEDWDL